MASTAANGSTPEPPTPVTGSMDSSIHLPAPPKSLSSGQAEKSRFGAESAMSLLVDSLKDRLLFAIPKKGRLMEKTLELLAGRSLSSLSGYWMS
jgi:ATP phosphoribosyltransferase